MSDESLRPAHVVGALERDQDATRAVLRAVDAAAPQVAMAREHLESLFSSMQPFPDGAHIAIMWPDPNSGEVRPKMISQHFPITAIEDAAESAVALDAYWNWNVYLTMCPHLDDLGPRRRGATIEAIASPGAWHDLDIHNASKAVHAAGNLPRTPEAGLALIAEAGLPPPSRIVRSGHGLYPLWLFNDGVWIFANEEEREIAHAVVKGIQRRIIEAAATHGWHQDTTSDLARVLRIPGTHNRKVNREPILVETVQRGPRYSREELLRFADIEHSARVSVLASPDEPSAAAVPRARPSQHRSSTGDGEQTEPTGDPCPRRIVELELRDLSNPELRAAAVLMLEGKPFAAPGNRDATMFKLASALARIAPFNPLEELLDIMRPSLAAIAAEPGAVLTLAEEEAKARAKLARHVKAERKSRRDAALVDDGALDEYATGSESEIQLRVERALASLDAPTPKCTLPEARDAIRRALRDHGPHRGLNVIRASCGTGKTTAMIELVVERAGLGKKTAISVAMHRQAEDIKRELRRRGVAVLHRMAPHRLVDDSDVEICRFVEQAQVVASAGLSVKKEMCLGLSGTGLGDARRSPCEFLETCPAASGRDGNEKSVVWIGPHQVLGEALEFIGNELLVIDEPPPPHKMTIITDKDFDDARHAASHLAGDAQIDLMIQAIQAAVPHAEEGTGVPELVESGARLIGLDKLPAVRVSWLGLAGSGPIHERLQAAVQAAVPDHSPRLSPSGLSAIRSGRTDRRFSSGMPIVATLVHALEDKAVDQPATPLEERVVSGAVEGKVYVMEEVPHLRAALLRAGPTTILDATIDMRMLHAFLGSWSEIFGGIRVHDVVAVDGAEIERRWILCASASRKRWLSDHGALNASHFVGPLRRALHVVGEDSARRNLAIITFKPIEDVLLAAWTATEPSGLRPAARAVARELQVWKARRGNLQVMHYGGLRGSNDLERVDALITLGDPWPELHSARARAILMKLGGDAHAADLCRAELAQAVGRFREVARDRPGIIVAVGQVPPPGWTRENTRIETLAIGRPRAATQGVRGDVLAAWRAEFGLSQREAARCIGISKTTLVRYERGES